MIRVGVDFGGTKIEVAALDATGAFLSRRRAPNPRDYDGALRTVRELVEAAEADAGVRVDRVGVGGPGSISPKDGLIRNANSTWINHRPLPVDLQRALGRRVRYANDANCLALSEATDGAGAGARGVFAVILGTGCGAGLVVDGRLVEGRNGVAGEIGHMPLPGFGPDDGAPVDCWCGRRNCLELFVSGSGLERDFYLTTGRKLSAQEIVSAWETVDVDAGEALARHADRLARGLAAVCDVIDPDVIVLGGGLSNIATLYVDLPGRIAPLVFSDSFATPILAARHGDSSGVRGAAWLWPLE